MEQTGLFPLDRVRLLDSDFKCAQEVDRAHMLAHDVDRLLAPFRREAGLSAKAEPYGNWESVGLDGHTAGHYLSALAMMWAATGDAEIKRRMDYMVDDLAACQQANGDGYVGGIPGSKKLWSAIAQGEINASGFGLNECWVPWYNIHKIYAGLRDAYLVGGSERARAVLVGMSNWCCSLLTNLSDEQVQTMLKAEHGGMNEVLADVYAMTGDIRYLTAAKRFCHLAILEPLVAGQDDLTGKHANTQIPKVIGFQRIAGLTADEAMHQAAVYFWENVTRERSVAIGGNSVNEHFHQPDDYRSMLEDRTGPETCNTYNMLRLSEQLFAATPDARYADFYERALFNHILSTQHPTLGGFVYFTPVRPRHYRVYSQAAQAFWCCVGTGFENHAKHGAFIYAKGAARNELYLNLFVPSELNWQEQGVVVRQETAFPDQSVTRLHLAMKRPTTFSLNIRHPWWVPAGELKVTINGTTEPLGSTPSSYVTVRRQWSDSDLIEIQLPMRLTTEPLLNRPSYIALFYGPIVLAAATGTADLVGLRAGDGRGDHISQGHLLPLDDAPALVIDKPADIPAAVTRSISGRLEFTANAIIRPEKYKDAKLVPFSRVHDSRYVLYWRVTTPASYESERKAIAAEERERLALEAITIDRVTPGAQQPEVDHAFKGKRTTAGTLAGRSCRDATGWFSYDMKRPPAGSATLMATYHGADRDRNFDIFVDDALTATVRLTGAKGGTFFSERYPLTSAAIGATGRPMVVRFVAREGSIAGRVFDVRVLRTS